MPNWMKNKVTFIGDDIKNVIKQHLTYDKNRRNFDFDFNTIVKMPKSLNVESGSRSSLGCRIILTTKHPKCFYIGEKKNKLSLKKANELINGLYPNRDIDDILLSPEELLKINEKLNQEELEEILKLGKTYISNFKKYGYTDWYNWSYAKWGCKWNACETYIDGNSVYFDTPWCHPESAIDKLAEMHPNLSIIHEYAEEQPGYYCGCTTYENGKRIDTLTYESLSKEAYELYFELWGPDDNFQYNEKTGTYGYVDSEE